MIWLDFRAEKLLVLNRNLQTPEIEDGVRVNIAPLQLNDLLAINVLAESDAKKAVEDLREWGRCRLFEILVA